MKVAIFCSGIIEDYSRVSAYAKVDKIICADGGARHCIALGVTPDLLVGDFDSILQEHLSFFKGQNVEILEFPTGKDYTDSELAIDKALAYGADEILILGALGGRMDHAVSNLFLLKKILDAGVSGVIVTEKDEIRLINHEIILDSVPDSKISLIPLTEIVEGITTKGLLYPLNHENLFIGTSRGVSNCFMQDKASIHLEKGLLMIIVSTE